MGFTIKHAKLEVPNEIKVGKGLILFPNKKVQTLIGTRIQVEMKGNKNTLEGRLESVDDNMNLHLIDTFELADGVKLRSLGSVVLRGNNIILLRPIEE